MNGLCWTSQRKGHFGFASNWHVRETEDGEVKTAYETGHVCDDTRRSIRREIIVMGDE